MIVFQYNPDTLTRTLTARATPAPASRTRTDVHDPTIKVERAIWLEQGLPAADLRGFASPGVHRGESVQMVPVSHYPFNESDPARLPPAERDKIDQVARFLSTSIRTPRSVASTTVGWIFSATAIP